MELGGWAALTLSGTTVDSENDSKHPLLPFLYLLALHMAPERHTQAAQALLRDRKQQCPKEETRVQAEASLRMGARYSGVHSVTLNQPMF